MAINADVHAPQQWELAIGEEIALGTAQTTAAWPFRASPGTLPSAPGASG